jgi:Transglycosylase SLT domain
MRENFDDPASGVAFAALPVVSALTGGAWRPLVLPSVSTLTRVALALGFGALLAGLTVQAGSRRSAPLETVKSWTPDTNVEREAPNATNPRARFLPRAPTPRIEALIAEAAVRHGVSAQLVHAVVEVESGFDPLAVSSVGALGLMQLTPPTARRFGVTDCFDARQNIFAGTRHLRELLDAYDGEVALAVAAYNAGPTAIARYRGVPPYPETLEYVRRVTTLATPPLSAPDVPPLEVVAVADAVLTLEPIVKTVVADTALPSDAAAAPNASPAE